MTEYIYSILKKYYGYDSFRFGQEDIIKKIIQGNDVMAVMPTGAGKSMCYQIPAVAMNGITIVISPLISLMKEQVDTLNQMGIRAAYLNSTLTYSQFRKAVNNAYNNIYKVIYVAPERLCTDVFLEFSKVANISLIAVDEAHCISQWGQDFRPSYLEISDYIKLLPKRPVVAAFTATATEIVKKDIELQLKLHKPYSITTSFDRENLYFSVQKPENKDAYLLEFIERNKDKFGIVYCATRSFTEKVAELLSNNGYEAAYYHAGMENDERSKVQEDFTYDRINIIVATTAFGMGIDKSNVSFVVHYNMPINIESYYQEAGRAGRDGSRAECMLLYSGSDVRLNKFMIDKGLNQKIDIEDNEREKLRAKADKRLKEMTFYATSDRCLRKELLKYFDEEYKGKCNNCSVCTGDQELFSLSKEGLSFIRLADRTGCKYGFNMLSDILTGADNERIYRNGFDKTAEYGILSKEGRGRVYKVSKWLEENEYIEYSTGDYPTIILLKKGREALGYVSNRIINRPLSNKNGLIMPDLLLMDKLKVLRRQIADKQSVPGYAIFSDMVISEMAAIKPKTLREFEQLKGVGNIKTEKYGEKFLEIIQKHL